MAIRTPYISLLTLTFLNRCISVKTSLGVLFLTMWINIDASPTIYRLVTSPSRFETSQWLFPLKMRKALGTRLYVVDLAQARIYF